MNEVFQTDRLPPSNIDAERCLIASMMLTEPHDRTMVFSTVKSLVSGRDFLQADHQIMFDEMLSMEAADQSIDAITICDSLQSRHLLEEVGGRHYVAIILNTIPSAAYYEQYAKIVREKSMLRQLISIGNDAIREAYLPTKIGDTSETLQRLAARCAEAASSGSGHASQSIGDVMIEVYSQLEKGGTTLIPTGFTALDDVIGGIALGEMIVVAARPSMGKSTLSRQLAQQVANAGVPVGYISLEESNPKIGRNLLASVARIDNRRIRSGAIQSEEWNRIAFGVEDLSRLPITFNSKARRMRDIQSTVACWAARDGIKFVVVDYLQRIRGVAGRSSYETTSTISLEMSDMCKQNNIALIAVAQLNRGPEHRDDKRPNMADLRDSGQIEQDADGILFLHRPDYYELSNPTYVPTHIGEIIIAKWRDGCRGGTVKLKTNMAHQRFENIDPGSHSSEQYESSFG